MTYKFRTKWVVNELATAGDAGGRVTGGGRWCGGQCGWAGQVERARGEWIHGEVTGGDVYQFPNLIPSVYGT